MKALSIALISLFVSTSAFAKYTKACGDEYGKIIRSETSSSLTTSSLANTDGLVGLGDIQAKSASLYLKIKNTKGAFSVETIRRSNGIETQGHRIKVSHNVLEDSEISFYFNTAGALLRYYNVAEQEGTWVCRGFKTDNEKVILETAAEIGEYLSEDDLPKNVEPLQRLSKKLKAEIAKQIQHRLDQSCTRRPMVSCAVIFEEGETHYRIKSSPSGKVIGYIIAIEDFVDDPLFDGGGVNIYIDAETFEVVTEEEWSA